MSIPAEVLGFIKAHVSDRVLSVYVDSARIRESIHAVPHLSDEWVARAEAALIAMDPKPDMMGAMCLYATDGDHVESWLPDPPEPLVAWNTGPVIFPFLIATSCDDILIVRLADDHASFARLNRGLTCVLNDSERCASEEELVAVVARMLGVMAGDAQVVLGGKPDVCERLQARLPASLAERCVVSVDISSDTPAQQLAHLARCAIRTLLTERQQELLAGLKQRAHRTRCASFGFEAVSAAARAGAIDRLMVSGSLWQERRQDVEVVTQQALRSGACVDVATPHSAEMLDAVAGGIAAGLRRVVPTEDPSPLSASATMSDRSA